MEELKAKDEQKPQTEPKAEALQTEVPTNQLDEESKPAQPKAKQPLNKKLLITLGIILVLALAIWAWFTFMNKSDSSTDDQAATPTVTDDNDEETEESEQPEEPLVVVLDEPITLVDVDDLDQLDDSYSEEFKQYMEDLLEKNVVDEFGCVNNYTISKVSSVNISGTTSYVSATGDDANNPCGGGARMVWYLQGENWKSYGYQSWLSCEELDKLNIYSEFVEYCLDKNDVEKPNPNGSIEDAEI